MLYSPVRYSVSSSISLLPKTVVQLACVKHAASVRPEPGSNSQLNYFAILLALCPSSLARFPGKALNSTFFALLFFLPLLTRL